jgi:asparagine synthase (glutamine-hydrolysing)
VEDKLSMAHGLETRIPFLDNDLVDFAMRLPARMKLAQLDRPAERTNENMVGKRHAHEARHRDGKLLLRQVMRRHLPPEISDGEKQGFSGPDGSWFKGESIEYVRRTILDRGSPIYQMLDHDAVGALVQEHLSGAVNRRLLIWSLLSLHHFLGHLGRRFAHA